VKKSLPEVFDAIAKAETIQEKTKIINEEYSVSLAGCLKMLFDPSIKFELPAGLPVDYKFNTHPYGSLEKMIRSIPPLVTLEAGPKLEKSWLRILQPLSKEEVILITALKDKDLEIGLTFADVQKIFPALFPELSAEDIEALQKKGKASSKAGVDDQGSVPAKPRVIKPGDYDPEADVVKVAKIDETETFGDEDVKSEVVISIPNVDEETAAIIEKAEEEFKKPAKKASAKKG